MPRYTFRLNGQAVTVDAWDPAQPLLYALRGPLALHGTTFGCGLGQCGACTVIVDKAATRSCQLPISRAAGRDITTLEGLGTPEKPDAVQAAFIAEQAAQCGYCPAVARLRGRRRHRDLSRSGRHPRQHGPRAGRRRDPIGMRLV